MEVLGVRDVSRLETLNNNDIRRLKSLFKDVKILVEYRGSKQADQAKRIKDIIPRAGEYVFEIEGQPPITVQVRSCRLYRGSDAHQNDSAILFGSERRPGNPYQTAHN
jgi:hypothetical protein